MTAPASRHRVLGVAGITAALGAVTLTGTGPAGRVLAEAVRLPAQGSFTTALAGTLWAWGSGLAIAVTVAVPAGVVLGAAPRLERVTRPLLDCVRPVPAVTLIPVAILMFGVHAETVLVAFAACWLVLVPTTYGVADVAPVMVDTARVFGFGPVGVAWRVRLPAAAGLVAVGIRQASGVGLIVAVSTELLSGGGLGGYVITAESGGDTTVVLAVLVWAGLAGAAIDAGLGMLTRRTMRWPIPRAAGPAPAAWPGRWWAVAGGAGVIAAAVAGWEVIARWAQNPYAPPPSVIAPGLYRTWLSGPVLHLGLTPAAVAALEPSLTRLLTAWAIAVLVGVPAGIVIGRCRPLAALTGPLIAFGRALPAPLLAPLFLAVFKIGGQMEIATIGAGVVWPVLTTAVDGARRLDPTWLDVARVYKLTAGQRIVRVMLPGVAPSVMAGLRMSLSMAVTLMAVAELTGSTSGLGYALQAAQQASDIPAMWSVIVVLGVTGYLLNTAVLAAEHRLLPWHQPSR